MMRITTFSSIGGLKLILCNNDGSEFGQLEVRKEDLSTIAIGCIQEVNTDASPQLIKLCGEVADLGCADMVPTELQKRFIAVCEDEHNASRREGETVRSYYRRLKDKYL